MRAPVLEVDRRLLAPGDIGEAQVGYSVLDQLA
jgi:hypothetical protein